MPSMPTAVPELSSPVAFNTGHVGDHVRVHDEVEQTARIVVGPTHFNLQGLVGAVGDDATDNSPLISGVMATNGPGIYVLPDPGGIYRFNSQVQVENKCVLSGLGRSATEIKAGASFPINTPLVRLGLGGSTVFGTRLENLTVHCNGVAGSTGVYSTEAMELSGIRNCLIRSFLDKGIYLDTSSVQNCELEFLEVMASVSATAATVGLQVDGYLRAARSITFNAESTGQMGTAIAVNAPGCSYRDIHIEKCTTGILVGQTVAVSSLEISNIYGHSTVTDLVRVSDDVGQSFSYVIQALTKNGRLGTL